jgi:hypothetical protein
MQCNNAGVLPLRLVPKSILLVYTIAITVIILHSTPADALCPVRCVLCVVHCVYHVP